MKTVLIIDDEAEYRAILGEILRQFGWQVLEAGDGEEGIRLAKLHRPAVVLCDLRMSKGDGFHVCRTLRADSTLQNSKLVITSGRDSEADRRSAFEAGANNFLPKPIAPQELFALLADSAASGANAALVPPDSAPLPQGEFSSALPARVRLKFWGVRGSIPTPGPTTVQYGGNTTCVEIRADGQIIVLDAGTGLRLLGLDLAAEFNTQPVAVTLLLTHTHWDHIQGLPFFQPVYKPQNELNIFGYEGARTGLEDVLSSQMESPVFPVGLRELPANIRIHELKEFDFKIGAVRVQACRANHPGVCVGYRLFTSAGSIAFFPDNEPRPRERAQSSSPAAPNLADGVGLDPRIIEFLRGTEVLIMDAQYDSEEYKQHRGWGHGCVDDVVALALQAEVKRLFLFHHDPRHDDAKVSEMVAHARQIVAAQGGTLAIEAAREGLSVEL
jgi:phosphoribosyl 1,2-cyclic phosphodiesterase/DNA-binding NarL/FixJ family response regulator